MKNILALVLVLLSISLFTTNIYGLIIGSRPEGLALTELRFQDDIELDYQQSTLELEKLSGLGPTKYATSATYIISKSLAHIPWYEEANPEKFNQLVPVYENYILYLMGKLSGIPEFQKYHFTDYRRSLRRGIGICGDASMVLSQLLNNKGINNKIVTMNGHVVVEAKIGETYVLDADFGVSIPHSMDEIKGNLMLIDDYYGEAGFSDTDIRVLRAAYSGDSQYWEDTKHFMTNKYYFERFSYIAKWLIPILLGLWGWKILKGKRGE